MNLNKSFLLNELLLKCKDLEISTGLTLCQTIGMNAIYMFKEYIWAYESQTYLRIVKKSCCLITLVALSSIG